MKRLAELFNVNLYLVSQVNPHVIPFAVRKQWRLMSLGGALVHLCSYCGDQLRHNIMLLWRHAERVIPYVNRLTIIPTAFGQTYVGDITIIPFTRLSDYTHIVTNPTPQRLREMTRITELLTWRKMAEIRNSCDIEVALDSCVRIMRAKLLRSSEMTVEQGTSLLSNRLASWAPEQFELMNKMVAPQDSTYTITRSSSLGADTERVAFIRRIAKVASVADFADDVLASNGVAPADMNLPGSHDQSEDISDTFIS
eukprot:CRZ06410.1 hypothetical protein [Spongospora subterranea]